MHLNPAEYVIHIFGGVRKTARAIGCVPSAVCRWRRPIKKDGCNGRIPSLAQMDILRAAAYRRLDIKPLDLISGRNIKK